MCDFSKVPRGILRHKRRLLCLGLLLRYILGALDFVHDMDDGPRSYSSKGGAGFLSCAHNVLIFFSKWSLTRAARVNISRGRYTMPPVA